MSEYKYKIGDIVTTSFDALEVDGIVIDVKDNACLVDFIDYNGYDYPHYMYIRMYMNGKTMWLSEPCIRYNKEKSRSNQINSILL